MIAPLLLLAQVAVVQPSGSPRPIVVRPAPGVQVVVHVEPRGPSGEPFVRADRLAEALSGSVSTVAGSREGVRLRVAGLTVDLTAEAAFARVDTTVVPLDVAPERDGTRFWIPVQLVTDVLPRVGRGLLYDGERRELRTFSAVASAAPAAAAPAASAASAPRPEPTTEPTRPEPQPTTTPSRTAPAARSGATPPAPAPAAPAPTTPPAAAPRRVRGTRIVVVDAGHGGVDSGMHGSPGGAPAVEEKDVTLGIARQLDAALRARGVRVVMTRTRDTLIALSDRGRIANEQNGELFVSIHVNAANPKWRNAAGYRGFETYFLADAKNDDARQVAVRENESLRFEAASTRREDPLDFIISDMAQNENQRESSRLATLVQRRMATVHPGPGHGVKQAGFKVLVTASMPAVLVEVGFGTNRDDATYITSAKGQRAIAEAIADAAVEYLARTDRVRADGGASR